MPKYDFHDVTTLQVCFRSSHVIMWSKFSTWLDMIMITKLGTLWLIMFNHICDYMVKSATWLNVWCDYKI
jgi:hypothetical protein